MKRTLFLSLIFLSPALFANPFETTLPNGLKVVVKEDHRAPVVVSQVWYRAGSVDEFNGTTGVAHVLEHMMFKGTKSVPAGQFSRIIAAAGGRENAFTNLDYTAYFQELHKSRLPLAMKLESDRMHNLNLSDKEFSKEIKVVMEERRLRTEDQPKAMVYEKMMSVAFQESPYRVPVIGWMNDLENLTAEDARAWYRKWYSPNNATLVVVGDVSHREVFELAKKYYGKIKSVTLPVRKPQIEPEQIGTKRITVKAEAKLPSITMAYHVPNLKNVEKDVDPYALEVLAGILDGNESSRLNKSLVRESRIASSAGAGYESVSRGPALFIVEATPSEGKTVTELEAAIREQIRKLIGEGVTEEELKRVRAQVTARHVYERDSVFYQAMQIGQVESTGFSYRDIETMLKKINEVSGKEVQEAARKYLKDDSLTVAILEPKVKTHEK